MTTNETMSRWPLQTVAARTPWLFGLALDAPLIGILKRWPDTLHAVTMEGTIKATASGRLYESACGKKGLRLMAWHNEPEIALLFPPTNRNLPSGMVRCDECWKLTGKKRPRSKWVRGDTR